MNEFITENEQAFLSGIKDPQTKKLVAFEMLVNKMNLADVWRSTDLEDEETS